jgi:hypothetical protein
MSKNSRNKSHYVLPPVLLIYAGIMAYIGRDNFFHPETRTTYLVSIAAEIIVIIALFFFLKRRNKLRSERESE